MSAPAPPGPAREEASAILLGAGAGRRLGAGSKAFLEAGGITLLERAVAQVRPHCAEIVIGLRPGEVARGRCLAGGPEITVTRGGASRQETLEILLSRCTGSYVLVHDVARPLAAAGLFAAVLATATRFGAAVPFVALSPRDSLALRDGEFLGAALPRDRILRTQTPQAYRRDLLEDALAKAKEQGIRETSAAALLVRAGHGVRLVPGDPANLKITFPEDWERARPLLAGRPDAKIGEAPNP